MIGYLLDRLKDKKQKSHKNTKKNDITEDSEYIEVEVEVEVDEEDLNEKQKKKTKNKKEKRKRWYRKTKIKKYRGPAFLLSILFLLYILISKLIILYSHEEYTLQARLSYINSVDSYKISYQIEDMDNSFGLKTSEKVCTPPAYLSTDTAVIKSSISCLKGTVVSQSYDRIKIKYNNLPKYIRFDDIFLYLDKTKIEPNSVIGDVNIKVKYFNGSYQIISIFQH